VDPDALQEELQDRFGTAQIKVKPAPGLQTDLIFVEAPASIPSGELETFFDENYPDADLSFSVFDATVSSNFREQATQALIFAFIGMSVIVFIVFRSPVPSLAVVLSAVSDIAITVAIMSVLGITLTLGTIAALLMVIGYSVDSDILLTTRLIKRRGELNAKARRAMKTGVTMTLTTLSAMIVLWVVSQHPTLDSIAIVLIFALIIDLINTWMLNTGILMWYLGKKESKKVSRRKRRSSA
jgi:preprotein translocase subunit SecF